jgi:homocysteine S-methyltransferase
VTSDLTNMRLERDPQNPLRLDGAIGTELIARGLQLRAEAPESWNLTHPDTVRAIHAAYAAAGAEAIQTNTFGATHPRLERFGLGAEVRELCLAGARLAREAAPGCLVLGSLGPSGETLPLGGRIELGWLEEAFAEAAAALAEGRVDAIHLETQFHPAELQAAVAGVRLGAAKLPVIVSIALMPGVTGLETPHGVPLKRMLQAVEASQPDAVGINCASDGERMLQAVLALRDALSLPIWAKPQARLSDKCATGRSSETPEGFARNALRLVDAGAAAIGGCCGTTPLMIGALHAALVRPPAQVAR